MLFFVNDYGYGAHPKVLEHLTETNMQPLTGYGNDEITASAAEKIKAACACPEGQVYFLTGGTQTNMVVIDALLRPYEGVVASSCGHVNTHEAGAIESTGHKVLTVPHRNGKLDADDLREYIETFYADESHNHMVFPGMVYISHPSEYGTLYTKNELERISAVCKAFDLPLFLDGARLGYGLTADTDVTLPDIARLTDVTGGGFYENIPRMLPEGARAVVKKDSYEVPPIFKMLQTDGEIEEDMMYNTFNMGIGLVLAVAPEDVDTTMEAIKAAGETPYVIGNIEAGEKGVTLC